MAVKELGDEAAMSSLPRPAWTTAVSATVLRHDTPLEQRRLFAGRAQAGQEQVGKLRLAWSCEFLVELLEQEPKGQLMALAWRAAMMGAQREPPNKVCRTCGCPR